MQKTNKILVEKLNSKNENAYEVVKTNDDIVEMKRKQYTQIEDGTTKVSVISEQFLNITSRKRQLDKGDTDRIHNKQKRWNNLLNIWQEVMKKARQG